MRMEHTTAESHLYNASVHSISWRDVTVTVKDRKTKQPKTLVDNIQGIVKAGESCVLLGPSGSGKTTLLNILARRPTKATAIKDSIFVNGHTLSNSTFRQISCYVEQQEALIGALTVSETLYFASRLANSTPITKDERLARINSLLASFGLVDQADTVIGTPLHKGISDGQKKRVAVSRQLVASPKILFLDEPTSGLDSAASFEVMHHLCSLAKRNNLIIICSIHQPSTSLFNLFDKLLLLAAGKQHYFGPVSNITEYYRNIGVGIPQQTNPAEFILQLVNTDFAQNKGNASRQLEDLQSAWKSSLFAKEIYDAILGAESTAVSFNIESKTKPAVIGQTVLLLHRAFVKSYRDPMTYGVRLAFQMNFSILIGTIWLRLDHEQESIGSLAGEIYFALSFMSLSAIISGPSAIEDYKQFIQDFRNGLYGATEFALANFLISLPYMFVLSLVFSILCYWLSNLLSSITGFCTWVLWVFLTLVAAEALIAFVVSIFANFVFTIAFASLLNGLLLCTQGFFIPYSKLNAFYKYAFHSWNYLAYGQEGLMVSQFSGATYTCGHNCRCLYDSNLASQCQITGESILDHYGYNSSGALGKNVGIMVAITLGYRLASWILLKFKQ